MPFSCQGRLPRERLCQSLLRGSSVPFAGSGWPFAGSPAIFATQVRAPNTMMFRLSRPPPSSKSSLHIVLLKDACHLLPFWYPCANEYRTLCRSGSLHYKPYMWRFKGRPYKKRQSSFSCSGRSRTLEGPISMWDRQYGYVSLSMCIQAPPPHQTFYCETCGHERQM